MKVFISYAREDIETAQKLRDDLEKAGIKTWLDKEDLLPGQDWELAIREAMKKSDFLLILLSSRSLHKRGYVQKELKMALELRGEFPKNKIFVIPARADNCEPQDEDLKNLQWADLFPSYKKGLDQILRALDPSHIKQPIWQEKIKTWLTVIVLLAIVAVGIIIFYPFEKSPKHLLPKPEKEITNSLSMKFVQIPTGSFIMGSPKDEPGRIDNETQHKVTLTRSFYIQTTEVTVGQWQAFVKETGYKSESETGDGAYDWTGNELKKKSKDWNWKNPGFEQTDNHPVTCISWNDTQEFLQWLNQKREGTYRLPTEAEWEYAARAGSRTAFANGGITEMKCYEIDPNLNNIGWYCGNSGHKTHEVGQKSRNAHSLYDMHGNVWEWCQDWYGDYPSDPVTDPGGSGSGSERVIRGCAWVSISQHCRLAHRSCNSPGDRGRDLGFRLVLSP